MHHNSANMNTVWIVDDDRSIRWVLEKALAREDIPYLSFGTAVDALAALEDVAQPPKAMISDIRMPGESGINLLQKVKTKYPQLPVIIMTAYSDLESAVAAFQGGGASRSLAPVDSGVILHLALGAHPIEHRAGDDRQPVRPALDFAAEHGRQPARLGGVLADRLAQLRAPGL